MESEWNSRYMEIYIDVCFEDKLFFYIFSCIFVKIFPASFAKGNVWIFVILKKGIFNY